MVIGKKTLFTIPGVYKASEYYTNKEFVPSKNKHLYVTPMKDTIVNKVCHATIWKRKKIWI
jgi:hypothetical protein